MLDVEIRLTFPSVPLPSQPEPRAERKSARTALNPTPVLIEFAVQQTKKATQLLCDDAGDDIFHVLLQISVSFVLPQASAPSPTAGRGVWSLLLPVN